MTAVAAKTVEEAIELLTASTPFVESPTQRRIRDGAALRTTFEAGRRRPELVWTDGAGVVGALQVNPELLVLDHFSAGVADELLAHATRVAAGLGCRESGLFHPPGPARPEVAELIDGLGRCGWRVLVERLHYEFDVVAGLGEDVPTSLRFSRPTSAADPRLRAAVAASLVGTADVHDRSEIERVGLEAVIRTNLHALLEDGVDSIHIASDDSDDVGIVCGLVSGSGRAFVSFVAVDPAHRGHGYAAQLTAWMTRQLIGAGATALVADTDTTNVAMARAFAAVGWPVTEIRTDLVLDT